MKYSNSNKMRQPANHMLALQPQYARNILKFSLKQPKTTQCYGNIERFPHVKPSTEAAV